MTRENISKAPEGLDSRLFWSETQSIMKRYLDPKNDLVFKRVFGEHPEVLRAFLNEVLPLKEGEKIESLEYLSPEQIPEIPVLKHTIVDVRCKDQQGRQFIVEMQMEWTLNFKQRVYFNACKAYVRQLGRGEKYELLQPVFGLSLVNDIFEKESPDNILGTPSQKYHSLGLSQKQVGEVHISRLGLVASHRPCKR